MRIVAIAGIAAVIGFIPFGTSPASAQNACTVQCGGKSGGCAANPPSVQRCYNKCMGAEICPQPKSGTKKK